MVQFLIALVRVKLQIITETAMIAFFFSNPSNTRAVRVPQIILFATRGTTPGLKRTDGLHLLIQAVRFLPVILESLSDVFEEEIF